MSHWNDDSWRDGYDEWKLRSPYDEYDEPDCQHEAFDIDMDGRAHCENCDLMWRATDAEIASHRDLQAEYDAWCRKRERREFWLWLTYPFRYPIYLFLRRIWPRKSLSVLVDEEIPF